MNAKSNDHTPGDLMRYAPSHDQQKRGTMGVPGIAPNDPRWAKYPMARAGELPKPGKVYKVGSCYHCGTLPDDTAHPPKFCTECGARFIPVEPQNASDKEEK